MSYVWPDMQHILVPFPCKSWLLSGPFRNAFCVSLCTSDKSISSSLEGETQGLVFPGSICVIARCGIHTISFERSSYLTEQFLSFVHKTCCVVCSGPCWLSTGALFCSLPWTGASYRNSVFVKTKDSCWKQYCLGLASKMPLLADCKNIKHINSFGNRIKRVNESNERWKQHFSLLVTVLCNWGPLSAVDGVLPQLLGEGCSDLGFLCVCLILTGILTEKGIIK